MIRCYTSVTNNYIPKARVLANSVKLFHPNWEFILVNAEPLPDHFDLDQEPFDRILPPDQWGIPDLNGWIFKHRVVEICTAIKGKMAYDLLQLPNTEKVIYLDPDIAVFNSLEPLVTLLDKHSILLTPHLLTPEKHRIAIMDNEISTLQHGVYNLGFLALAKRGEGPDFAAWWRDRLLEFCYDDIPNGLFTDQKWIDLAPAFFEDLHILRDPGYNVASWNLSSRVLSMDAEGRIMINGKFPLRFYHFTGFDSGAGAVMTKRYSEENSIVSEIWQWYHRALEKASRDGLNEYEWKYNYFDNGLPVTKEMRQIFRYNKEIQRYFDDPYDVERKDGGFSTWWETGKYPIPILDQEDEDD